jgi:hypothetical protein
MSLWRVLADVVMYLHILLPLLFVGVIVFSLIREVGLQWWLLFCVMMGLWIIMEIAPKFGWTKNCPLTDLEYSLRRLYDPSESWLRTRSLPATIIFNISGIEVPEYVFTAIFGIITATAIGIVIIKIIIHKKPSRSESGS